MSKAYYYVKNFTFKEVNNLFAYQVKDPSILTKHQKISRLYKGTLRKLFAAHIHCTRNKNFPLFHDLARATREDFDKLYESEDPTLLDVTVEKYELMIEELFEPDASLNHTRPYSNLNGKLILYGNDALQSDPIGYYKQRSVTGKPSGVGFYEEYPDHGHAWVYTSVTDEDLVGMEDDELEYRVDESKDEVRKHLDELHK